MPSLPQDQGQHGASFLPVGLELTEAPEPTRRDVTRMSQRPGEGTPRTAMAEAVWVGRQSAQGHGVSMGMADRLALARLIDSRGPGLQGWPLPAWAWPQVSGAGRTVLACEPWTARWSAHIRM